MALNYFTITSKSAHRWKYSRRHKDVAAAVPGGRIKELLLEQQQLQLQACKARHAETQSTSS
jgi:hypothetical protein